MKKRRRLTIGEPRDVYYISGELFKKGDDFTNTLARKVKTRIKKSHLKKKTKKAVMEKLFGGFEKHRLENTFKMLKKKLVKARGKKIPKQSASRRIMRVYENINPDKALIDESLKTMKWKLK